MKSNAPSDEQFANTYLALFKNTTDAVLLLRDDSLTGSAAACALLGYAEDELAGLALADLFGVNTAPVKTFFRRLADAGQSSGDFPMRRKERAPTMVSVDGSSFTSPGGVRYQTLRLRLAGSESSLITQRQHGEVGLRAVIETLPDLFFLKDTAGVYLLCNKQFERYVGLAEADIIGKTDYDLSDQANADAIRLQDAEAVMSGVTVTEEKWLSFKTGGQRALMAVSKTPMRSADGHVVGVLGIARDITDIKRHEYMMAANNTALAQIARGVPLADTLTQIARNIESQNPDLLVSIMLLDESGRHLHTGAAPSLPASFNAALDDITIGSKVGSCGTAAYLHAPVFVEDIETSPLWDDWRGLAREYGLRACWSTPIDSSAGVLLGTFAIYCRQPRRAVAADIRLIEMATSIAAVAIEHSSVELRRTMIADKLRDHEARLALALEGSETGVWDRDLEKRFVNYSAGWKALFGYGPDDIPSRNVDSVGRLHPDDLPHVKAAFQSHLKGLTDLYTAEHRVLCKDGSYKWVISRGKVVDRAPDGTALRMIGTTTDITDMRALTEKLRQGHDLITNLTNEVPGLVYQYKLRTDGTSYFPYASEGIRSIYEVAPEHVARDASAIHKLIHPDDYAAFVDSLRVSAECLKPWHLEYRVILPVQGLAWRLGNAQPRQLMDGSILWHGFITDISERKALEKAILENEEKYRTVTENSPDAIIRYDREVRRIYVNKVYEKISGIPLADLLGQRPNDISVLGQDAAVSLVEKLQDVIVHGLESDMEVKFVRDGDAFIFHLRAIPEFDAKGNVTSVLTFSRDITERKRMEAELQQLATTDYLTGLPNRRHFMSKLTEELARIQRLGVPRTSVLMIDIDHFKNINDSHGHATGDLVLKHFADVARRALRRIDTVGRVGGEEFAFILPGADVHEAEIFAERFREKIEHSHVTHEALEIAFTVSIGISAIDPEDANADAILNRTDKALYRAKTSGRNRVEIAVEPN